MGKIPNAQDIAFISGAKIERDAGNLVLTPEAGKNVFVPVDIATAVTEVDTVTGGTSNWYDVTNLTVDVTTGKAAKILVIAEVNTKYSSPYPNLDENVRILESGGSVTVGREAKTIHNSGTEVYTQVSLHGLYTAASATTYTFKVQIKKSDGSANLTSLGGVITATVYYE